MRNANMQWVRWVVEYQKCKSEGRAVTLLRHGAVQLVFNFD